MAHIFSDNPELEHRIRRGIAQGRLLMMAIKIAVRIGAAALFAFAIDQAANLFYPGMSRWTEGFITALLVCGFAAYIERYMPWYYPEHDD